MGRVIYQIDFPLRQSLSGKIISDVNDLYNVGYDSKVKWDKLFADMYEVGKQSNEVNTKSHRYAFLDQTLEFYDTKYARIQSEARVAASMGLTNKELHKMVHDQIIETYINTCYWYGGKDGYLNTMNEEIIMNNPGNAEPRLHPHIQLLVHNIC